LPIQAIVQNALNIEATYSLEAATEHLHDILHIKHATIAFEPVTMNGVFAIVVLHSLPS
jgi:hypothetical protein